jgi:hypothetical protein
LPTRPAFRSACQFPPGTSKWNRIEHRLFSYITINWRGKPLRFLQTVINLIAATTTSTGLEVYARLDDRSFPDKIRVPDQEIQAITSTATSSIPNGPTESKRNVNYLRVLWTCESACERLESRLPPLGRTPMEALFRLVLLRPPIEQDPEHPSIELAQGTQFQKQLADALGKDDRRNLAVAVARAYIQSADFVAAPEQNDLATELAKLAEGLAALAPDASRAAVRKVISDSFGANAAKVVKLDGFTRALTRTRDAILAIKFVQEEHRRPIEVLSRQLRDLELVEKVAADTSFPGATGAVQRHRARSLRLPTQAELESVLGSDKLDEERRKQLEEAEKNRMKNAATLLQRYRDLADSVGELTRLHAGDFRATPIAAAEAVSLPEALEPVAVLTERVAFGERLSEITLRRLQVTTDDGQPEPGTDDGQPEPGTDDGQPEPGTDDGQPEPGTGGGADLAATALSVSPRLLTGTPGFTPPDIADIGFRVAPAAIKGLSGGTAGVLAGRGLDLSDRALDRVVADLRTELEDVGSQLNGIFGSEQRISIKRVGGALVSISSPLMSPWSEVLFAAGVEQALQVLPPDARIPHTRGDVTPAGIADLLVVKQQLIGYEAADVAHIENVLRGESKEREHTRRRETEEITFVETELTTTEERELESTSRFELSRETSTTINEDASLKAGLTVSGKYGPTVEFSASAEGSVSRSKEEATKTAASFSQDVTERSATKVTERILERSSLRVTNEVIEKNAHRLDNTGGAGHVSGVYQWVNKVYQAQMLNYGLRTIFDFMVPEPAAMLIHVMQSAHASETALTKPPAFTLQPDQVTEANYAYWVRIYGATDVVPPPEIYLTIGHDFSAGGGDDKTNYNHSGQLTIPDGYQAIQGTVGVVSNIWDSSGTTDLVFGRRVKRLSGADWVWTTSLDDERGAVPFGINTFRLSDVAAAVEVKCQRTARAVKAWAADTHAKLTNAYRARLAEYEERLAALEVQAGVAIEGQNPALNVELMRDELKKHCLSIFTNQHFVLFDAVDTGFYGLPQVDVNEAAGEGAYVRFFEQAFEWEHLTWVTYPYFWGRKSKWAERIHYEDPDPLFNQFLKAGYCRVSVPARPGFEGAIDHFMTFGELWNGGPLPPVSNPLYLPIADELAERLDRPGDEIPQGEPWLVRLPTTLVKLRADDALPEWEQNAEGEWVET